MTRKNNANKLYWASSNDPSIENVTLPDRIQCFRCDKFKGQSSYSGNKLTQLRLATRANKTVENPICMTCTPGQLVELECTGCLKTKGRAKFSNQQLKDPDRALCDPCRWDQQNEPAVGGDRGSEGSGGGRDEDGDSPDDDGNDGGDTTLAGTFSGLSVGSSRSASGLWGANTSLASNTDTAISTNTTTTNRGKPKNNAGSKFAKVKAAPTKFSSDAARRVREEDREEDAAAADDVQEEWSDNDTD